MAGAPNTPRIRGPLVPQELMAETDSVQTVNEAGQFAETALRFVGPVNVPQVVVQL